MLNYTGLTRGLIKKKCLQHKDDISETFLNTTVPTGCLLQTLSFPAEKALSS